MVTRLCGDKTWHPERRCPELRTAHAAPVPSDNHGRCHSGSRGRGSPRSRVRTPTAVMPTSLACSVFSCKLLVGWGEGCLVFSETRARECRPPEVESAMFSVGHDIEGDELDISLPSPVSQSLATRPQTPRLVSRMPAPRQPTTFMRR